MEVCLPNVRESELVMMQHLNANNTKSNCFHSFKNSLHLNPGMEGCSLARSSSLSSLSNGLCIITKHTRYLSDKCCCMMSTTRVMSKYLKITYHIDDVLLGWKHFIEGKE